MDTYLSFSRPPPRFVCPLSKTIMTEPVLSLTTGIIYERSAVTAWQTDKGDTCPVTGQRLGVLVPNESLKAEIDRWKQQVKGFRRIQRGSPTTYFLADATASPPHLAPTNARRKNKDVDPVTQQQHAKARDEMFDMVDKMMQTFTDAGMSDYITRVMDDEDKDPSRTTPASSLPDLNALIEDATSSGYQYNVEYSSIFRQGSNMPFPRSI